MTGEDEKQKGKRKKRRKQKAAERRKTNQPTKQTNPLAHLQLEIHAVVLRHGAREREVGQVAANADAHGEAVEAERREVEYAALGDLFSLL